MVKNVTNFYVKATYAYCLCVEPATSVKIKMAKSQWILLRTSINTSFVFTRRKITEAKTLQNKER